jgi:hypothetical protein
MSVAPHSVVAGVDGGPADDLARVAYELATLLGVQLNLVHVVGASPVAAPGESLPARRMHLDGVIGVRSDSDVDALAMLDGIMGVLGDPAMGRHAIRFCDPGRRLAKAGRGMARSTHRRGHARQRARDG